MRHLEPAILTSVLSQKFVAIVGELSATLARHSEEGVAVLYCEEA
jgi:hypothetical protein